MLVSAMVLFGVYERERGVGEGGRDRETKKEAKSEYGSNASMLVWAGRLAPIPIPTPAWRTLIQRSVRCGQNADGAGRDAQRQQDALCQPQQLSQLLRQDPPGQFVFRLRECINPGF